jgi:hypothetical protein
MNIQPQVKVVGANGQISLGKEFAGKMVMINQINESTWIIKSGEFIPDSEKWLYQGNSEQKVDKALVWAEKNKPKDNFDELAQGIEDDQNKN